MAIKKITRRWLLNSFGVILMIIVLVEVVACVAVSRNYYETVEKTLLTQAELTGSVLNQYAQDSAETNFADRVVSYVATFSQRDSMELMTIDQSGRIVLTSSGFDPDDKSLPDYTQAMEEGRSGRFVGELQTGGRVMAITLITTMENEPSVAAIRMVTSLNNVDRHIALVIMGMVLLGVGVLILILFSSSYFISSIVYPVGEIGETARRIAQGDFEARLTKKTNDEIGELCDVINYMAGELGSAERIKNDFISSVSHELRTPLTAIKGWGETLLSDEGNDKEMLNKGMSVIINETGRLSSMVEELLDFSRMQSGQLKLIRSRMDALAELSEAVFMYTQRAQRENIELFFAESDEIAVVNGDPNKLRQVFINVIDNAIKYSDPGGRVAITYRITSQWFTIQVADSGIGIKAEDLPQIKTKFYKADFTRRGSGIGLAVADEIINRHGGRLDVDSIYGKGTTVTITLPVYQKLDDIAQVDVDTVESQ